MAPSKDYYNPSNKSVSSGDIVYAEDLNKINTAVDTALEEIAADIDLVSAQISDGGTQSRDWAAADPGVRPDPVEDLYSARAYSIETKGWATSSGDIISAATGEVIPGVKSARYYADSAQLSSETAASSSASAASYSSSASNSAALAAVAASTSTTKAEEAEASATASYSSATVSNSYAIEASGYKDQVLAALKNVGFLASISQDLVNGLPSLSSAPANTIVAANNTGDSWEYLSVSTYGKSLLTSTSADSLGNSLGIENLESNIGLLDIRLDAIVQHQYPNLLINGDFNIWQAGTFSNVSGYNSADQWYLWFSGGSTASIQKVDFPVGQSLEGNPKSCANINYTYFDNSSEFVLLDNKIEDVTLLSGSTITVTFYAYNSSGTKPISVTIYQNFGTGGSPSAEVIVPSSQKINVLSTGWSKYSLTFTLPSIYGKILGTNPNTSFTRIRFWISAGSNFDGQTAALGHQSGGLWLSRIKVEANSSFSGYDKVDYPRDYLLCKRYYEVINAIFSPNTLHNTLRFTPKPFAPTVTTSGNTGFPVYSLITNQELYQSSAATLTGTAKITLTSYL